MSKTCASALVLFMSNLSVCRADDIPVLTVCEALTDVPKYDGQSVIVVGRLSHTEEGAWIDAECGFKARNAGARVHDRDLGSLRQIGICAATPAARTLQMESAAPEAKLTEVQRTTSLRVINKIHYTDEWYAIFGRLETGLPREVRSGDSRPFTIDGFGHLSASPAQIIAPQNGYRKLRYHAF